MKAVVYSKYGPPEVLEIRELATPAPGADEILIRVRAAEVTKADCELRSFRFPVKWFWLPLRIALGIFSPRRPVLGGYFAGEVRSVGEDVTRFRPGDEIFGCCGLRLGAHGEFICLPAGYTLAPKPTNASFEEAAAVPLGGLNALHFMNRANLQAGESVLVNGAGGSIGTFGVQIARSRGAEVTAVDSPIKEEMLRSIGANHFIDYKQEDFTRSGRSYDVILDMVARSSYSRCVKALRPGGRYLMANPRLSDMIRATFTSRFTDKKAIFAFAGETEEELLALKAMIEQGLIRPAVDRVFPMEQAVEAHRRVETEQRLGTVVLSLGNEEGAGDPA